MAEAVSAVRASLVLLVPKSCTRIATADHPAVEDGPVDTRLFGREIIHRASHGSLGIGSVGTVGGLDLGHGIAGEVGDVEGGLFPEDSELPPELRSQRGLGVCLASPLHLHFAPVLAQSPSARPPPPAGGGDAETNLILARPPGRSVPQSALRAERSAGNWQIRSGSERRWGRSRPPERLDEPLHRQINHLPRRRCCLACRRFAPTGA